MNPSSGSNSLKLRRTGLFSNATRGKRKKLGLEEENTENIEIEIVDDAPTKRACRESWAQLIRNFLWY